MFFAVAANVAILRVKVYLVKPTVYILCMPFLKAKIQTSVSLGT